MQTTRARHLALNSLIVGITFIVCPLCALAADNTQISKLWGRTGELWHSQSRLPDFSFAGYHRGERPLPVRKAELNVKDFGAVGDGKTDDTAAFRKAIEASPGKVLLIPAGRYKITNFLDIKTSETVVRGEGADKSVLFFPISLNVIKPNWGATTTGQRTSNYSWSGGFLRVVGSVSGKQLAQVTAPAKRGDQSLTVSDCEGLSSGDHVRLLMNDTSDNSLATHIYQNAPYSLANLHGRTCESFICRITKIATASNKIEFDRPLRLDVRLHWKPQITPANSTIEEVGIEQLGFEFPNTPYKGHFSEVGYNAITIGGARNCWVRDVRVHNSDSGIYVRSTNTTLQNIVITSDREVERARKATGHHGITLSGQDNLLSRFDIQTRFIHDITVSRGSAGNVVSTGRGIDLAFDHHCYALHSNLFTDIDLGIGSRMFQSGGGVKLGRHSGSFETFWNIRGQRSQGWPTGWGPDQMNLVGVQSDKESITDADGRWFEVFRTGTKLVPGNLYQAQLARRLAAEKGKDLKQK